MPPPAVGAVPWAVVDIARLFLPAVRGRFPDGEVEAAWAEYEELTQQQFELAMDGGLFGRGRAGPMVDERVQAAADRHRAAWRRWLDRQAEHGAAAGPGAR